MTGDRERLRATFDSAADGYQQARPDYPDALYDALIGTAQLRSGDRLLEVGAGTGKATLPLARRGFRITCVELQEVYEEIGEGLPEGAAYLQPSELPDEREEIERSGLFGDVVVRHFDWEVAYDADGYLRLLDTFSGHIAMKPWQRDRLHSEIRHRLGERADGHLRRGWGAVLHVARRLDELPRTTTARRC
jgi:SAM-dependent methyltransferase